MSEKLNLFGDYGYTDFKKDSDFQYAIENKNVFESLTFEQFEKQLDMMFSAYMLERLENLGGKGDTEELLLMSYFYTLSEQQSFFELTQSIIGKQYQTIKNSTSIISKDVMFELIVLFQSFVDIYTNEIEKIDHRYLRFEGIEGHTPISCGLYRLLLVNGRIDDGFDNKKITTQLFYTIRQFFSSYLANYYFTKSLEKQKQEKDFLRKFELMSTSEAYLSFLCLIVDTLDSEQREEYSQTIINVLDGKPRQLRDEEMISLNETFEDILQAYENDKNTDLNQFQSQVTSFIDFMFKDFKPSSKIQKTRHMQIVGTTLSFVPVDNFIFSQELDNLKIENIENVFGMQGLELPKSMILVKDANLFNSKGEKLRWGDIPKELDCSKLEGTYYILDQMNGYFIKDESVVEDTSNQKKYNPFEETHNLFQEPKKVNLDYIKRKAAYKIHNGKLVQNVLK